MHKLISTLALGLALAAQAAPAGPYDEGADAKAALQAGLAQAQAARLPLLVVFGANWCADCKMLDMAFHNGASAALIAQHFKVVKVDVGRFDRNVDIAQRYEVPLKQGIPAVALLSSDGKLLYATRGGELADARKMGDSGVHDFFAKLVAERGRSR